MWLRELDEFDKQYQNYKKGRENIQSEAVKSNKIVKKKRNRLYMEICYIQEEGETFNYELFDKLQYIL